MTEEQMARYIRVCRGWPDPQAGNFQLLRLCTGMRRGEVGLYTLQRLMTHKSPMMTQRYAPLRDETLKHGANVMSRLVAAAEEGVKETTK